MTRVGVISVLVALAACKGNSNSNSNSNSTSNGSASASASASASDDASASAPGGGLLGGFGLDPMQILGNIRDNLGKPGPYDEPSQSAGYQDSAPHYVELDLSGSITELDTVSLFGGGGTPLRALTERLHDLAGDATVVGVLLRVGDLSISLPDVTELRAAIAGVRAAQKKVLCHAEAAGNAEYLVLSACDQIGLVSMGELDVTGPAAMPIHLKGLLDKLGIAADFLHVGAYKGAAEPLTRDAPSPEMTETLGAILDRAYDTMVADIADGRHLPPDQVKALIDRGMISEDAAIDAKLIDSVASFDAFRDATLGTTPWVRLPVEAKDDPMRAMFKLARFFGVMPASRPSGARLALVYAVGDIVDGSGDGQIGAREQIASGTLVPALAVLAADDDVKAVVLRIDSPGGSARAAEQIWGAVAALAKKKPVIVSMSDYAASGGYYIASAATKIYALDDTLTGSIGVVGGKLAPAAGLARLGVTTFPMGRGKRATMMASLTPWSPDERDAVQKSMDAVYGVFVQRVAAGRKMDKAAVEKIAAGRVWTGTKGKELGLVDAIGTLDDAIAAAEQAGGLPGDAVIEEYPGTVTLRDYLVKFGAVQLPYGMSSTVTELARDLSPALAAAIEHALRQVASFRDAHVQTVALVPPISL